MNQNTTVKWLRSHRTLTATSSVLGACLLWWCAVYDNYHPVVRGELYRSAQMSVENLVAHAKRDHLATVINLRPETNQTWHAAESEACAKRGITYVDFPMTGNRAPDHQSMDSLVRIMKSAPRPILIHCEHGADRTGLAVALYLRFIRGLAEHDAHSALSIRYGHTTGFGMGCFDVAFSQYCSER